MSEENRKGLPPPSTSSRVPPQSNVKQAHPLWELTVARVKLFLREPSAVFWTFGFPILMSVVLGIAFRSRPPEPARVGVLAGPEAEKTSTQLAANKDLVPVVLPEPDARNALRTGKVAVLLVPGNPRTFELDPMRPESRLARALADDTLQRAEGRVDVTRVEDRTITEPGGRYIDFLIPGLIGMNIMAAGMWGIGYSVVEMRTRKLLKRLAATPMSRAHFLLSFVFMRLLGLLIEVPVPLLFGWLVFDVTVRGSLLAVVALTVVGAMAFAGLGLLVAARAQNTQTVGGLMNLVMFPMYLCSGIFFSSANFPDAVQPFIKALPLTQLNDGLRAVINDGGSFSAALFPLAVMAVLAVVCFGAAVKIFRWQ